MSEPYSGQARFYDAWYAEKDYAHEAAFVMAQLGLASGDALLDVACGTGRHDSFFHAAGIRVVGVDLSPDMVALARARVPHADFRVGDMTALSALSLPPVAATVCLFDAIGCAGDDDAVSRALAGMRAATAAGGGLALEFWRDAAFLRGGAEPVRERAFAWQGERLTRRSTTVVDAAARCATVTFEVFDAGGAALAPAEVHRVRFFGDMEMRGLVSKLGYRELRSFGGYHGGPVDDDAFHIVLLARRE